MSPGILGRYAHCRHSQFRSSEKKIRGWDFSLPLFFFLLFFLLAFAGACAQFGMIGSCLSDCGLPVAVQSLPYPVPHHAHPRLAGTRSRRWLRVLVLPLLDHVLVSGTFHGDEMVHTLTWANGFFILQTVL
ncbi:hypothetical protein K438DRAFT_1835042 [Mycena galopus ATCC 62051]|nr:hypothetical protein K438DRAFT_1835042 [Mycena galopus ATCC 62051]